MTSKRILSLVLALVMLMALVPSTLIASALAEEDNANAVTKQPPKWTWTPSSTGRTSRAATGASNSVVVTVKAISRAKIPKLWPC